MWSALHNVFRAAVLFVVCTCVLPITVAGVVLAGFLFLPLPASVPEPKPISISQATRVLDVNGNEIAVFRAFDQSKPVPPQDIPLVLKQAVVAAEDSRFYQHDGVDLKGSLRAFVRDVQGGRAAQGGSTITQQYVKNTYTGKQRTIVRKVKEAVLASQLDRQIEKDEILYRYLSSTYFGEGAYGVGAAAQVYFRKDVKALSASEAATLVGVIPAPSRYSPRVNITAAENKRQIVLEKMLQQRYLDDAAYQAAKAAVLVQSDVPVDPAKGTGVYPPPKVETRYPYFVDYVRRYAIGKYGEDRVFKGGLVIQTTLDPDLQAEADRLTHAAIDGVKPLTDARGRPDPMMMGLVAVEPATGYVKALVGGRDFDDPSYGKVNIALGNCPTRPADTPISVGAACWDEALPVEGGGGGRQPGSSWKPIALAAAFEKGRTPESTVNAPEVFTVPGCKGDKCAIRNAADGEGRGSMTLQFATTASVNTAYATLANQIGVPAIGDMAKRLGVGQAWVSPRVHGLSYVLGAQEVSPLEMAAAYSVFANRGQRNPATPVVLTRDQSGAVIEDNRTPKNLPVLEPRVADMVNKVLQGPLDSGTARGKDLDRPAAGKTGTTNDYTSAWFVGYTPALSTAVFMGYQNPQLSPTRPASMRNVKGVSRVFGGTIPASTWQTFMNFALKDVPATDFTEPAKPKLPRDETLRAQRGGIDPGERRSVEGTPVGGTYELAPGVPRAPAPPRPVTTAPPGSTTTTTPQGPLPTLIP